MKPCKYACLAACNLYCDGKALCAIIPGIMDANRVPLKTLVTILCEGCKAMLHLASMANQFRFPVCTDCQAKVDLLPKEDAMLNPDNPSPEAEVEIEFTQFIFPHGTRSRQYIPRPQSIASKANLLRIMGFSFEIENKDGQIWMSCVNHHADESAAVDRFCANGPQVPIMVDEMINEAFQRFYK